MNRVNDPKLRGELEAKGVSGVECVRDVRVHPWGAPHSADLTVCVEGTISVRAGHYIAGEVECAITDSIERIVRVMVHVEPS
jgi:divalent metal cation (Fe/Co/Zn/Cd) transporter